MVTRVKSGDERAAITRKLQHKGQSFGTGVQKTCTSKTHANGSW